MRRRPSSTRVPTWSQASRTSTEGPSTSGTSWETSARLTDHGGCRAAGPGCASSPASGRPRRGPRRRRRSRVGPAPSRSRRRRGARGVPLQHAPVVAGVAPRPSRAPTRRGSRGPAGRARRPPTSRAPPNSARRPRRTASASTSSSKLVKNCHGVDAAHSSPMKIIGVVGREQVQRGPGRLHARRERRPRCGRRPSGCRPGRGSAGSPAGDGRRAARRRPARPTGDRGRWTCVPSWRNPRVSTLASTASGPASSRAPPPAKSA